MRQLLRPALYVSAIGAYLPRGRVTVEQAIARGLYDAEAASKSGFRSVAVERTRYPLEMGLKACQDALSNSARPDLKLSILIHTSIHRHGHQRLWPAATYLQRELGLASDAMVFSLSHGCNGAFIAATVAAGLLSRSKDSCAIIVGADRFADSMFDRWRSDLGTIYGDGAAALVLSKAPGGLLVEFLDIESEVRLEDMYRDQEPFPETPQTLLREHAIAEAKQAYLAKNGRDHFETLFLGALRRLRERLLKNTDLGERPASYVVYPNVGAGISAALYSKIFGELAERDHWKFGRSIGHTGVSDQLIGLHDLLRRGRLRSGQRALLIGAGNGLSCSAMLLSIE